MAGVWLDQAFPVYPNGFPKYIISQFERQIGRRTLGNKPASGTEIIKELGVEHVTTGFPIVYTSRDSVFQVAAHEDVIHRRALSHVRDRAEDSWTAPTEWAGVIARPFAGPPSNFQRTERRRLRRRTAEADASRCVAVSAAPGIRRRQDSRHLQRPRCARLRHDEE
jgi:phosphopentomutase